MATKEEELMTFMNVGSHRNWQKKVEQYEEAEQWINSLYKQETTLADGLTHPNTLIREYAESIRKGGIEHFREIHRALNKKKG